MKSLFRETYIKDILNRNGLSQSDTLEELLECVSSSIGSLTNPRKLSNAFQSNKNVSLSAPTIAKYLGLFTDSFLISRALRYDIKGKKYISAPCKYYFSDLGIRNASLNFRQMEKTHLMENLIYNELLYRGYDLDVGETTLYQKEGGDAQKRKSVEVDFVCNRIDKRIYVQSAYSIENEGKRIQEMRSLLGIRDNFTKAIATWDRCVKHYSEEGILIMDIFDFLLDPDSLE